MAELLCVGLSQGADMEVEGWAADGAEAEARISAGGADVVLVNWALAGGQRLDLRAAGTRSALGLVRRMKRRCPEVKVVVMNLAAEVDALMCVNAGASGVLLRGASAGALMAVIRAVDGGECGCPPRQAVRLLSCLANGESAGRGSGRSGVAVSLTPCERRILRFVELDRSNQEIADHLLVRCSTVKNHQHQVYQKLE